jgi:hypothetical protein
MKRPDLFGVGFGLALVGAATWLIGGAKTPKTRAQRLLASAEPPPAIIRPCFEPYAPQPPLLSAGGSSVGEPESI